MFTALFTTYPASTGSNFKHEQNGGRLIMLRSAIVSISLMFLICMTAFAQDSTSKVQVFGGYSLVHSGNGGVDGPTLDTTFGAVPGTFGVNRNFSGWDSAVQ